MAIQNLMALGITDVAKDFIIHPLVVALKILCRAVKLREVLERLKAQDEIVTKLP